MRLRSHSRGYILLLLVVMMLLFGVGSVLYKASQSPATVSGQRSVTTTARFDKVEEALLSFVKNNQRLPCPASPTDAAGGISAVSAASASCANATGVVPWGALGLSLSDTLDAWDRRISYRVFDGLKGFTQSGGLDPSNCTTNSLITSYGSSATPLDATTGLCATNPHGTLKSEFLTFTGKGLQVSDFSNTKSNIAYVLISHGATGYGSWAANTSDPQFTLPNAASHETNNLGASGPFYIEAESDATVDATAAAHFDDLLRYKSAVDLVAKSGLDAHDWGWISVAEAFSTNSLVLNTTQVSTLKFTITNSNKDNSASTTPSSTALNAILSDALTPLKVAAAPNVQSTCVGTSYSPVAGTTTLSFPVGFGVPAATVSGGTLTNGICTWSVDVSGDVTTPNLYSQTSITNSFAGGNSTSGGFRTAAGWNQAAVTSTTPSGLPLAGSFYSPGLTAVSPSAVPGSTTSQSLTLTWDGSGASTGGFIYGATVTFNNVTAGQSYTVPATLSSLTPLTSLTASQIFGATKSSWTAQVNIPNGPTSYLSSGTVPFTVYAANSDTALTAATLTAAVGHTVTAGSSTGVGTINFSDFTVTSKLTSTYPNLALLTISPFTGLGVANSAGTSLVPLHSTTTGTANGIRYTLPIAYRYFGVTLYGFGKSSSSSIERATVTYYDSAGTALGTPQTIRACNVGLNSQAASYALDPGFSFSQVEIKPQTRSPSGASQFLIGEVAFCLTTASCVTQYSANNNASNCAYP